MPKFQTELLPAKTNWSGGFQIGVIDPSKIVSDYLGAPISGAWLTCYMIRRFGWPNVGTDSYKNLCGWLLRTPIEGLYLGVCPSLGSDKSHFSVKYNRKVEKLLYHDPRRAAFRARHDAALLRWWKEEGRHQYTFGGGTREGDEDELVYEWGETDGIVFGLWRRTPKHPKLSTNRLPKNSMTNWWIARFLEKHHPEVKLPKLRKREREEHKTRFQIKAETAIRATVADLLRFTNIRDFSFNLLGDANQTPDRFRLIAKREVQYFEGAGNTPEYWYKRRK